MRHIQSIALVQCMVSLMAQQVVYVLTIKLKRVKDREKEGFRWTKHVFNVDDAFGYWYGVNVVCIAATSETHSLHVQGTVAVHN